MEKLTELSDKMRRLDAMLLTCSYAIGNRDLFGEGPQSIALVQDYIGAELEACCAGMENLSKMQCEDNPV